LVDLFLFALIMTANNMITYLAGKYDYLRFCFDLDLKVVFLFFTVGSFLGQFPPLQSYASIKLGQLT